MHAVIVSIGGYQHASGRCCYVTHGTYQRADCQDYENPSKETDEEQGRQDTISHGGTKQYEKHQVVRLVSSFHEQVKLYSK